MNSQGSIKDGHDGCISLGKYMDGVERRAPMAIISSTIILLFLFLETLNYEKSLNVSSSTFGNEVYFTYGKTNMPEGGNKFHTIIGQFGESSVGVCHMQLLFFSF